jgi:hypothetical protein
VSHSFHVQLFLVKYKQITGGAVKLLDSFSAAPAEKFENPAVGE